MTKKKGEKIKPLFSTRLEELLKDKHLKKYELAEMIYTSPQTISKAANGIRLTKATAEDIVALFPEYNLSWLLGQEGATKYVADIGRGIDELKALYERKRNSLRADYVEGLANVCNYIGGYHADWNIDSMTFERMSDGSSMVFSYSELLEFEEDINAFFQFRLQKLFEKGR